MDEIDVLLASKVAKAGIRAVAICKKNMIYQNDESFFRFGLRKVGSLTFGDAEGTKDYREVPLRDRMFFKAEFSTFQADTSLLKELIKSHATAGGIDAFIAAERNSKTTHDGIFEFSGIMERELGLDFKYVRTNKESYCDFILEREFDYNEGTMIISRAEQLGLLTHGWLEQPNPAGLDFSKVPFPALNKFSINTQSNRIFPTYQLLDWKLSIESDGQKNCDKITNINWMKVSLEITAFTARMENATQITSLPSDATVFIQCSNPLSFQPGYLYKPNAEIYEFGAGIFGTQNIFKIGDDDRIVKMKFEGRVPLYDFVFEPYENLTKVKVIRTGDINHD